MGLSDIRDLINLELPQLNEALAPNRTSTQVHAVQNNVNTQNRFFYKINPRHFILLSL